jgi:hypothetical protein
LKDGAFRGVAVPLRPGRNRRRVGETEQRREGRRLHLGEVDAAQATFGRLAGEKDVLPAGQGRASGCGRHSFVIFIIYHPDFYGNAVDPAGTFPGLGGRIGTLVLVNALRSALADITHPLVFMWVCNGVEIILRGRLKTGLRASPVVG